jgi:hypothetical protein
MADKPEQTSNLAKVQFDSDGGAALANMQDVWSFARAILESGWAPKSFTNVQSIVVAIQYGAELSISPMAALQGIAVINGRPSIYGDLMLALCRRATDVWDESGFKEELDPQTSSAICQCRRKGGNTCTRSFSVEDAKRAKLWGKAGPWSDHPSRMLQMRARAFALRDTFPDVLKGTHSQEEMTGGADYSAIVEGTADEIPVDPVPPPALNVADLSKKAKKDKVPKVVTKDEAPKVDNSQVEAPIAQCATPNEKVENLWNKLSKAKRAKALEVLGYESYDDLKGLTDEADLDIAVSTLLSV